MRKLFLTGFTALFLLVSITAGTGALAADTASMAKDEMTVISTATDAGYMDVTPENARLLIATTDNLVIIDVSPKYDEGHLPGALHYYVGDGTLDEAIPMLDKSKTYLVYCHVDSASILGATKLADAGFAPVYRLEGNFSAWVEAGYPVSTLTMDQEILINNAAMTGVRAEDGFIDINPEAANALIEAIADLVVVDVSPKYDEGHLPGAVHYFVGDGTLDAAIPMLDRNKPYLVYCHTDEASMMGAAKLVEAGFWPVFRLEGNFPAWAAAGLPIEK